MNDIKQIAQEFITTENPFKCSQLLATAKQEIQAVEFKSYTTTMKELGLSYFIGLDSSTKIVKGQKKDFTTAVLYLAPASNAGINVCPKASEGCIKACLFTAGRAKMDIKSGLLKIYVSRVIKTWLAVWNKPVFNAIVSHEINKYRAKAKKNGMSFAVRLNGTSDLFFSDIYKAFPNIQFYEYTKSLKYVERLAGLKNVHFTFSYSESNQQDVIKAFEMGFNIAVPVIDEALESILKNPLAYNADETDLRFLDSELFPAGRFAVLKVKKSMGWQDGVKAGFVVDHIGFRTILASLVFSKVA